MTSFDARELDYELPESSIAQAPLAERDAARLLCVARDAEGFMHHTVRALPELLAPSLIVLNDTRVIPARLFGHKPTGGRVELLLIERVAGAFARERWRALGRASKGLREGERIAIGDGTLTATVLAPQGPTGMLEVELVADAGSAAEAIERLGAMPLPPYIRRAAEAEDASRYQTVYAAQPGAVAAPTAGLHFTERLLEALRARGHELAFVTLHVGPGTFAPLRSEDLREHVMHEERFEIPDATSEAIARARREGRQVLAVGTTVVRTLESAADEAGMVAPGARETSIFIYPPYRFRVVDALLTNFHLPRSTLLALVMAFGGIERIRAAYRTAIEEGYRFYSYGDAMLIGGRAATNASR